MIFYSMKNKIKRLLSAALALVMTVSMMQPMALNAFADGPNEPVEENATCGICGHMALHHDVQTANDRISRCRMCIAAEEESCECAGKIWAECAGDDSGISGFPDTINGYSITWPDGCEINDFDRVVFCPHRELIFSPFKLWTNERKWVNIDNLTEKVYTVCDAGCQVIVSNPSTHTHNSDAYGQDTAYHWTKCTDDEDNNGPLVEHTWNKGVCTVCSYPCAHAMFTEGQCAYCDYVCDHNGEIYGVCKICQEDMGPDPFVDIKAALAGKTDAQVCAHFNANLDACGGIAKVLNALNQLRDVGEVTEFYSGFWQIRDSSYAVLGTVTVSDTHSFYHGACERCGFACDHNGAASGTCKICNEYLSSPSEFLADMKGQLAGKTDADVCVFLEDMGSKDRENGTAKVLAKLGTLDNVTDIESLWGDTWFFNASGNRYSLYMNQQHAYQDGSCWRCSYQCSHNGADTGFCEICKKDLDALTPLDTLLAAIGDNECVELNDNMAGKMIHGKAAVIDALQQVNGIDPDIWHREGGTNWDFHDADGNDYTLSVYGEAHDFSYGDSCSVCHYECAHRGGTATCQSKAVCELCGNSYGSMAAHNWSAWDNGARHCQTSGCTAEETCGHFNFIRGICDNCGMDAFAEIKAALNGKTDADVCARIQNDRAGFSFGIDAVLSELGNLADVQVVLSNGPNCWFIMADGNTYSVYAFDHEFDNGRCLYCSYECTHNGEIYGVCEICKKQLLTPVVPVTGVTLDKETVSMKVGERVTLTATVEPENATDRFVDWISYKTDVATVSYGVVTAVAPGTATIVAINYESGCMAFCEVTVEAPHKHDGITFDKEIPATGGTLTAGNYYLAEDVTLSANLTISGTVNLCLNGHVLKGTGSGSVISVPSGAVLNLFDCDPETEHKGNMSGGAWAWDSGTDTGSIAITGGVITGGYTTGGGGGIIVRGTFNMYGGTIAGNKATSRSHGGGVRITSGSFTMNGGAIQNNYSDSQAGGVFVSKGTTFTMNGGTIANNYASNGGAGVYATETGRFTLNGGTISGNSSNGSQGGGGVRVEYANCFTMTGGSITGNTAAYAGGGVNAPNLTMNGGTISGNKSGGIGGGVSVGAITLGGNATITGNTRGSAVQNLYLADGKFITVNGDFTGMVGVTTANAAGGVISSNAVAENIVAHITADNSALEVRTDADGKLIVAVPVYPVTGVTLDKTTASLEIDDTLTLTAIVAPENATNQNVTWESDNANVAAVENGVVTAAAPGEATITVTTEDGSFTASCVVTVVNGDAQFAAEVDALIDAIGTVEFTDASKAAIDTARTAYDALTDAQKALVTKLDALTAAETAYADLKAESEAAAALAQAKADAKAAIEAAADGHTSANVVAAIDAAKAAIDAAASLDEVNTAKTKGVAAVNNVKHSYKENGKYSWANVDDNFAMSYEAVCEECHKVTIKQAAVEQEASEGYVTYTATTDEGKVYTKKVLETIVVTYNDEPYEYDYLEIVKLESDEKVDWYADGVLVSTASKQYAFAATKNVTITTKEATVAKPIVTISANNRVWDAAASKYVFTYTTNWSVPEGYTFVKGGFIYRYGAANYGQIDRDTVFAKGTTVNSSLKVKYGTFDYTLKMSTSYATRDMFGIGFIVVKDQKGVEQTIYSDTMAINRAIG